MKHVKGYENLSHQNKELFDTVYKLHLSSMDKEVRSFHIDEQINEVKWDPMSDCLRVYFKNGKTYKYWKNKTWDQV